MEVSLILGDFAELDSGTGKAHILGAGWSVTGSIPSPQAVIAFVRVPPDRALSPIPITLRLLDKTGQPVEISGLGGPQRLEISGQIEMRIPDDWDQASDLTTTFAVNIGPIPLTPGGHYKWIAEVDGKEQAQAPFAVRAA